MDMATELRVSPPSIVYEGGAGAFVGLTTKNLILTILTAGIYRFWAKAAVRRHLWERTRVLGDALEWRGTGLQLLFGALIAFVVLIAPLGLLSFALQGLLGSGNWWLAGALYLVLFVAVSYIIGVGTYRSWRYLLSHTRWRGIRGGMVTGGWSFGTLYLKMAVVQLLSLGFLIPYTSVRLWNAQWNDASFGSTAFVANADWRPLRRRWLPVWLAQLGLGIGFYALLWSRLEPLMRDGGIGTPPEEALRIIGTVYGILIVGGLVIGLVWVGYLAAFWREVLGATRLGGMRLGFDASGRVWLRFYLTNIALIIGTLGLGYLVLPYRTFTFFARHMVTSGVLDTDAMAQSTLAQPGQGDGIADAFDLAAV